ncbi:MAG: hypothetical protein SF053_05120 [Bacteroidia bacterium]|nr:hypothetical protein [Bacteroidia bacterium]
MCRITLVVTVLFSASQVAQGQSPFVFKQGEEMYGGGTNWRVISMLGYTTQGYHMITGDMTYPVAVFSYNSQAPTYQDIMLETYTEDLKLKRKIKFPASVDKLYQVNFMSAGLYNGKMYFFFIPQDGVGLHVMVCDLRAETPVIEEVTLEDRKLAGYTQVHSLGTFLSDDHGPQISFSPDSSKILIHYMVEDESQSKKRTFGYMQVFDTELNKLWERETIDEAVFLDKKQNANTAPKILFTPTLQTMPADMSRMDIAVTNEGDAYMVATFELKLEVEWFAYAYLSPNDNGAAISFQLLGDTTRSWSIPLVRISPSGDAWVGVTAVAEKKREKVIYGASLRRGTKLSEFIQPLNATMDALRTDPPGKMSGGRSEEYRYYMHGIILGDQGEVIYLCINSMRTMKTLDALAVNADGSVRWHQNSGFMEFTNPLAAGTFVVTYNDRCYILLQFHMPLIYDRDRLFMNPSDFLPKGESSSLGMYAWVLDQDGQAEKLVIELTGGISSIYPLNGIAQTSPNTFTAVRGNFNALGKTPFRLVQITAQ